MYGSGPFWKVFLRFVGATITIGIIVLITVTITIINLIVITVSPRIAKQSQRWTLMVVLGLLQVSEVRQNVQNLPTTEFSTAD